MQRLALLDYGRFFAALSVVFFHYFYNGITNGKIATLEHTWFAEIASYGHFGVQFFFIISGYVIFFSLKDKGAAAFLKSRLKRLYPTYWCAIIFTSFFIYLWGGGYSNYSYSETNYYKFHDVTALCWCSRRGWCLLDAVL